MAARPSALDRYSALLEPELRAAVGIERSPMYDMLRYHMGWTDRMGMPAAHAPADRVHGAACLLAAEAAGAAAERAAPAASAAELASAFAMVHEDLRDGTPGGAERPSLWWAWGHSQGINAGDALYALARLAVIRSRERGLPAKAVVRASAALDEACLDFTAAQFDNVEGESEARRDPQEYLTVLEGKAGSLFGAALVLGGIAAGASATTIDALRGFGTKAGAAWRARDEMDTVRGSTGDGASRLIELMDKKQSLPVIHALAHATGEDRATLQAAPRRERLLDDVAMGQVLDAIEHAGTWDFVESAIDGLLSEARATLDGADLDPAKTEELLAVAEYLAGPKD